MRSSDKSRINKPAMSTTTTTTNSFQSDLISLAVLIEIGKGYGSGLYLATESAIYLVTARHVFWKAQVDAQTKKVKAFNLISPVVNILSYSVKSDFESADQVQVDLRVLFNNKQLSFSHTHDVCVFKLGDIASDGKMNLVEGVNKISSNLNINSAHLSMIKPFAEIEIAEDLYVIGYPKALAMIPTNAFNFNKPLVRKGIVSGKNPNRTIVIDCAVYPGNSGGPVFITEKRIEQTERGMRMSDKRYLAGIVSKFVPWLNNRFKPPHHVENSGYGLMVAFDEVQKEILKLG